MYVQLTKYPDYLVSDMGEIVSLKRGKWRLLNPGLNWCGYPIVGLRQDMKTFSKRVHHLVLEAFVGERPSRQVVNHKNGIKTDNRLDNLEYVTSQFNNLHAYSMGLNPGRKGIPNGKA